jgi:hypothetical protein
MEFVACFLMSRRFPFLSALGTDELSYNPSVFPAAVLDEYGCRSDYAVHDESKDPSKWSGKRSIGNI